MKRSLLGVLLCLLMPVFCFAQEEENTPKINKKNLVIKEWNTDPKGGQRTLDHVTTYNADGRKVEEIEYNASGQKWRKRYELDATGKVTTEYVYDGRNRLQTSKKFEYNHFGRKKVQYTYDAKGRLLSVKHFEYIVKEDN